MLGAGRSDVPLASGTARQGRAALCATAHSERLTTKSLGCYNGYMAINNENNFVGEIGQKAFIVREGQVLMCRGVGEDVWDFPGGRLHFNEVPSDGLRRELKEELGVDSVDIEAPIYTFSIIPKSGTPRFFVLYKCSLKDNSANFTLQKEEIEEIRWISKEEIEGLQTIFEWKDALNRYFSVK